MELVPSLLINVKSGR